ncbi:hypothetical protein EYF80_009548 [Liparis tanakae]|uniref:Uncharacterized protein n=1 Tax=Liparis tanakae TaxID=230148 RepID=A0A4Z2ISR0_9TELE|nr:hypothetical protein EYF80_009548 [Liparis tanakae]
MQHVMFKCHVGWKLSSKHPDTPRQAGSRQGPLTIRDTDRVICDEAMEMLRGNGRTETERERAAETEPDAHTTQQHLAHQAFSSIREEGRHGALRLCEAVDAETQPDPPNGADT